MLISVIEILLVIAILVALVFEEQLIAWEDRHVPKVRSFFASLGYAFLIQLEKLFDRFARVCAQIIITYRKKRAQKCRG